MASREALSANGSWKLVVEAWSVNMWVYRAMGATSRVFETAPRSFWDWLFGRSTGWRSIKAEFVSASGVLTTSVIPGATGAIPGSPNNRTNDSEADCRAWTVFVGVSIPLTPTFEPSGAPRPGGNTRALADGVIAGGSASLRGETLSLSGVPYP